MDAVKHYIASLGREEGAVTNIKFCVGERRGLGAEDIAKEAMNAVAMHQNGLATDATSFPEPELDMVDLGSILGKKPA
jgi:hypothetical protein